MVDSLRSLKTLRHQAAIILAASHVLFMCAVHETSGVICIPRSLTRDEASISLPLSVSYSTYLFEILLLLFELNSVIFEMEYKE